MTGDLKFVSEDRRRGRTRLTRLGGLAAGVVLVLALASLAFGAQQIGAGMQVKPLATPTPAAVVAAASTEPAVPPSPAVEPSSAVSTAPAGCPTDRAQWRLVPYTLPSGDTFTMIDPPCVMEQAEQAFAEYIVAMAERGREWTPEDDAYFYSDATFTGLLSGESISPPPPDGWQTVCAESVRDDGAPVTSDDVHVVFYTVSEDGLVANLFLILGDFPGATRFYDCETGEFQREERATDLTLLMQPVVYDPQTSRWRLGWRYDTVQQVARGEIDPQSTIDVVLMAQGRGP